MHLYSAFLFVQDYLHRFAIFKRNSALNQMKNRWLYRQETRYSMIILRIRIKRGLIPVQRTWRALRSKVCCDKYSIILGFQRKVQLSLYFFSSSEEYQVTGIHSHRAASPPLEMIEWEHCLFWDKSMHDGNRSSACSTAHPPSFSGHFPGVRFAFLDSILRQTDRRMQPRIITSDQQSRFITPLSADRHPHVSELLGERVEMVLRRESDWLCHYLLRS